MIGAKPMSFVEYSMKDEAALVDDVRRARRVWIRMMVWVVALFGAIAVTASGTETWYETLAVCVMAWGSGRAAMITQRRMSAYRFGWLAGRQSMLSSLAEANRRGMDLDEWEKLEYERNLVVLSR